MPWTDKQEHFRAVAHGWKPKNPKLKKGGLTADKAKELLSEAKHKALGGK